jgi:outer membrane receptor protein involved in Fe transport
MIPLRTQSGPEQLLGVAVFLVLLLAPPAGAQDPAERTETLDPPAASEAASEAPSAAASAGAEGATWSERIVVTATRADQTADQVPLHARVLDRVELESGPELGLIDVLRRLPSVHLQGDRSTLVASPIDGGIAMRGLGGTAQSRVLVMVDCTPINDPFGSYVSWTRVPQEVVDRIESLPGGVGSWGNLALTGVVNVITRSAEQRAIDLRISTGNHGTREAAASFSDIGRTWAGWVAANGLDTDGYYLFRAEARGPVDVPRRRRYGTLSGRLDRELGVGASLRLTTTFFEENRVMSTPLSRETNIERMLAVSYDQVTRMGSSWRLHLFGRALDLEENSPAQNALRTIELPSQKLDVPAQSVGASAVWFSPGAARHAMRIGVDAHLVTIEATTLFGFDGTRFTGRVITEGEQQVLGAFVQDTWELSERTTVVYGGRLDTIRVRDGRRAQTDLLTGAASTTVAIPDDTRTAFNPSLGITHAVSAALRVRGAAYTGFRAGTPNELFIDSVGRNRNLSNPKLAPEKLTGGEVGVDFTPSRALATRVTVFANESRDLIERIDLGRAPPEGGIVEPCGFMAPGGRCRQRRNVGEVRVIGVELEQEARLSPRWRLHLSGALTDSEITRAPGLEQIVGNRVLRTPREAATLALHYRDERSTATARLLYVGDRFHDTANLLPLEEQLYVDLSFSLAFGMRWELLAGVQNLLDERYVVNLSGDFPEYGTPRLVHLGVRFRSR